MSSNQRVMVLVDRTRHLGAMRRLFYSVTEEHIADVFILVTWNRPLRKTMQRAVGKSFAAGHTQRGMDY